MAKIQNHTEPPWHDLAFFSGLPEDDIRDLWHASNINEYPAGKHIFRQGDKADRLFIILQGRVKRYLGTTTGEEAIVTLFSLGDVVGEAAAFENADHYFSAEATEDTRLIEIPIKALKERAKKNPDIMMRIISALSRDMYKLQIENEHRFLMDAPHRVGCLLLQLSSDIPGEGGVFTLPYDKSLAARCLGMRPETFSRALAELKPIGVTATKSHEVTIEKFSCLIDYCCTHCTSSPEKCPGSQRDRSACKEHPQD